MGRSKNPTGELGFADVGGMRRSARLSNWFD